MPTGPFNMAFVLTLIIALGILTAALFIPFLTPIVLGLLIVYLTFPLFRQLQGWIGKPRVAAFLVLLLVFLIIVGPLAYLGFLMVGQAQAVSENLEPDSFARSIEAGVNRTFAIIDVEPPAGANGTELLARLTAEAQNYAQSKLPDIIGVLTNLFIGIFILAFVIYYGLLDGPSLWTYLKGILPLTRSQFAHLEREIGNTVYGVFLGQVVGAALQGTLGAIGFILFGVPNVILWGIVMTVLAIIPILGAFLVWAPAALWLLLIGKTTSGVLLFLWGIIVVSQIDNVVKPILVGSRAEIHPVVVMVGVIGGFFVFGVMGFLLGPLVVSLFIAVLNFWKQDYVPAYKISRFEELESLRASRALDAIARRTREEHGGAVEDAEAEASDEALEDDGDHGDDGDEGDAGPR